MKTIKLTKIDLSGKKSGQVSVNTPYKDLDFNQTMISQVLNAYLSNARTSNAHTKTRAMVSGTGKKPYKQKGTGHARFGSLRTPIHRGGGIAFGPTNNKNYSKKLDKKVRKKSLALLLNQKNIDKEVFVIPKIDIKTPKTKEVLAKITGYAFKDGNILILTEKHDKTLYLSLRNIPYIDIKNAKDVNTLDLATYDNIVFTGDSYKNIFNTEDNKNKTVKND